MTPPRSTYEDFDQLAALIGSAAHMVLMLAQLEQKPLGRGGAFENLYRKLTDLQNQALSIADGRFDESVESAFQLELAPPEQPDPTH